MGQKVDWLYTKQHLVFKLQGMQRKVSIVIQGSHLFWGKDRGIFAVCSIVGPYQEELLSLFGD